MPKTTCTLTITETDGALEVTANIPDDAKSTIAEALAHNLLGEARRMMAKTTGQIAPITKNPE